MPKIRLFATDLDGTLLLPNRKPHPEAKAALAEARDAGIITVIATGRIRQSTILVSEEFGHVGPMICSNGAHCLDADGSEIYGRFVPVEVKELLYDFATQRNAHLAAYSRNGVQFIRKTLWGEEYRKRISINIDENVSREQFLTGDSFKVLIMDSPENVQKFREMLEPSTAKMGVDITESEPEYLEFLPGGSNKASGLQAIAAKYNVQQSETAALGDYLNDEAMLRWAGFSGAMGNGLQAVKDICDVTVRANVDGGFVQFIREYLLR